MVLLSNVWLTKVDAALNNRKGVCIDYLKPKDCWDNSQNIDTIQLYINRWIDLYVI